MSSSMLTHIISLQKGDLVYNVSLNLFVWRILLVRSSVWEILSSCTRVSWFER